MIAAGAVAMICACGDDSAANNPATPIANNACASAVVTADAWLFDTGAGYLVVYADGNVTNAAGQPVGYFDSAAGIIMDLTGAPIAQGVDIAALTACAANAIKDPVTGDIEKLSSSSEATNLTDPTNPTSSAGGTPTDPSDPTNPTDPQNPTDPTSSAGTEPTDPTSSAEGTDPTESSSSVNTDPDLDENGFPTIESYGAPPAEYTKEIRDNGKTGWNSRYWDGCKPHCSWLSSVDTTSEETYQAGRTVARNCNVHDVEVPAFTLGHAVQQYWMGYEGTNSACDTKDPTGTFACTDMAPIAVNENLSYAYVAGSGKQYQYGCGKCYHLQYNGGKSDGDVKKTHKALNGKHIVVMVSNIGHDVVEGQFDLLVPGGGVGAFDALSTQLGLTDASVLGANGGGIGRVCFEQVGWDGEVADFQKCIIDGCEKAFAKWPNLLRGCKWYAEWYMAADNPTYNWEEVECPQYLIDHYMTTINTTKDNRYRWKDDWSNYKKGDVIETQDCLTDEYPQGCAP